MYKCSQTIELSKITHRGKRCIKVSFDKTDTLIQKIKSIKGRRWSKTKKCWYVPYDKKSFEALKNIFGDCELIYPNTSISTKKINTDNKSDDSSTINYVTYQHQGEVKRKITGKVIIAKQLDQNWIEFYVPFQHVKWINVFRHINGRRWDEEKTCWILPNVKESYWLLKEHVGLNNIKFEFNIQKNIPESYHFKYTGTKPKKKVKTKSFNLLNEAQKKAIYQLEEQIILRQLSHYTLKSYRNHLIAIFLFFPKIEPEDITVKDIEAYLLNQIKFKKISESTQNSIINAIKAYWEKALYRSKKWIEIPRPKKSKSLPNVFSQDEVVRLIESPKNLKHKLILLIIYSAGLRLGEVVNIRRKDISLHRRTIFIKKGKGKKDRFVTLAEEVIPYLEKYYNIYNPSYWLLEGQHGGQYSKSSVQKVFRIALEDSKVYAYGTVHTLRHSYATHCVENGFSVGLLKEALGHGSIKTTEKYLHISNHALKKLKSPLDIIKGKKENKVD